MKILYCYSVLALVLTNKVLCEAYNDSIRLFETLLDTYNPLVRPVANWTSDNVTVTLKLKLVRLVDLNLEDNIFHIEAILQQKWHDRYLQWKPEDHGGITNLHLDEQLVWLPDLIPYNNAYGNYVLETETGKVSVHHTGQITRNTYATFRLHCDLNVKDFPFDSQTCHLKLGSWTYDGYALDLRLEKDVVDLNEFYMSVHYDVTETSALRKEKYYPCCKEPYPDVKFFFHIKRRHLFQRTFYVTPFIIVPFLSLSVFYLPSESKQKIRLCLFLLLATIALSLFQSSLTHVSTLSILGRHSVFMMISVALLNAVTVVIINVHFRTPKTHKMPSWVEFLFLKLLARCLLISWPTVNKKDSEQIQDVAVRDIIPVKEFTEKEDTPNKGEILVKPESSELKDCNCPGYSSLYRLILYAAEYLGAKAADRQGADEWKKVAIVLDRLFLCIFSIVFIVGTCLIYA